MVKTFFFLGCALFVPHSSTIRISWETKKERLSYRKQYIEGLVRGISLFWLHAFLSMSFSCFLRLLPPLSQMTQLWNGRYEDAYIVMGCILCGDIMSKRSKIWKSIIWYYTRFLQAALFFNSPSVFLSFFMTWASNVV